MIPGQQITPTLQLVRPLGKGGMGSVWVAHQLALGTQVAVKFMSPEYARDDELVARFRQEAGIAAQIKSPHVTQVFDHGMTADGVLYIVMELLEGEDLRTRIRRLGPLPPEEVARIVGQAAKALGRAHQMGIIHRDIKPDNVFLVDSDGEIFVKLLDFGVAKRVAGTDVTATATGSVFGTPSYMSPEQMICAKHVDYRADLWALGVVAYFALAGKLPFTGENLGALAVAVHTGAFAPPTVVRRGLPPGIDTWMRRALQRDPAARFASAKAMAEALALAVGAPRPAMTSMAEISAVGPVAAPGPAWPGGPRAEQLAPADVDANGRGRPAPGTLSSAGVSSRDPGLQLAQERRRSRAVAAIVAGGVGVILVGGLAVLLALPTERRAEAEPVDEMAQPAGHGAAAPPEETASPAEAPAPPASDGLMEEIEIAPQPITAQPPDEPRSAEPPPSATSKGDGAPPAAPAGTATPATPTAPAPPTSKPPPPPAAGQAEAPQPEPGKKKKWFD